ncbi:MAG TPA: hypothetical protein VF527_19650 [Pyrinomonadaceae bacterium]|jgi:hypothetical protein
MNPTSTDFSLHALEARFEMQYYQNELMYDDGGGGDYGYYGNSWDDLGSGDAYAGTYQTASDGSGAMLDDGTYTDGSSGAFPSYDTRPYDPSCEPTFRCSPAPTSKCVICRC